MPSVFNARMLADTVRGADCYCLLLRACRQEVGLLPEGSPIELPSSLWNAPSSLLNSRKLGHIEFYSKNLIILGSGGKMTKWLHTLRLCITRIEIIEL